MKTLWYFLFPNYETYHYIKGIWNINVSSDLFGDWKETKYCHFWVEYSNRLKKYRLKTGGYKPLEHNLYEVELNYVLNLNKHSK